MIARLGWLLAFLALAGCASVAVPGAADADWPGYGNTARQEHYAPAEQVNRETVRDLGLAWSFDLPAGNTATEPIAVDGVLYFASGLSVVHAIDAASGRLLWRFDPEAGKAAGLNLRLGWGVRGLAWDAGRLFVGTQDGRLIALDARSGRQLWSVRTYSPDDPAYISGAPRVFAGKVLIGFAGTMGAMRGYVTAYDAATGRQAWRFWTVPGDPAKGFENPAMAMAAKTWAGEWWTFGGGGMVWNSMAFDAEAGLVYIGVGSPYPWNHRIRSAGKGDNLFVGSIVALDVGTGTYRWHYQTVPGDTWDYDATMDITLAELEIGGRMRKVLMQAPKNGFLYVIDRLSGELLVAEPIVRVTWASRVDLKSGRPVEAPGARYDQTGVPVVLSPTSLAAHNWLPMAYSPAARLLYIPVVEWQARYADIAGDWQPPKTARTSDGAIDVSGGPLAGMPRPEGALRAFDPATGRKVWEVRQPTYLNGGVLATGGGLVFQGGIEGMLVAHDAADGRKLWQFDARAPIMGPPIAYTVGGRQYLSILTGTGMAFSMNAAALAGPEVEALAIDPRSQARRVLTFALGGTARLPPRVAPPPPPEDPGFVADAALAGEGARLYAMHCSVCHGALAVGAGSAPDLRRSAVPLDGDGFAAVVQGGALEPRGMPRFGEFDAGRLAALRQYLRAQAGELRRHGAVRLDGVPPAPLQVR